MLVHVAGARRAPHIFHKARGDVSPAVARQANPSVSAGGGVGGHLLSVLSVLSLDRLEPLCASVLMCAGAGSMRCVVWRSDTVCLVVLYYYLYDRFVIVSCDHSQGVAAARCGRAHVLMWALWGV